MVTSDTPLSYNWRVKRLLKILSDGKWRRTIKGRSIGAGTINLCIDQGFIRTRRVDRKRRGPFEEYRIAFRITRLGEKMLRTGRLVTQKPSQRWLRTYGPQTVGDAIGRATGHA